MITHSNNHGFQNLYCRSFSIFILSFKFSPLTPAKKCLSILKVYWRKHGCYHNFSCLNLCFIFPACCGFWKTGPLAPVCSSVHGMHSLAGSGHSCPLSSQARGNNVLLHSVHVFASWADTSNDSNSEAFFSDSNYSGLQIQDSQLVSSFL